MSVERTVSEVIAAAPEDVRAFYVDLDNLQRVHPLIVAVRRVARTGGPDGYVSRYRVTDRIPFGRFALPVTYTATLDVPQQGEVCTEARQFPRVRVRGRVSFDGVDGGTVLTERLRIDAPRPLIAFTARRAVAAHIAMLAGISRYFG